MSQADTVSSVPRLKDKNMVRESISKMKNENAAGSSGVVSEMVKEVGEAGVDMITDLDHHIIGEGVLFLALLLFVTREKKILQKKETIGD